MTLVLTTTYAREKPIYYRGFKHAIYLGSWAKKCHTKVCERRKSSVSTSIYVPFKFESIKMSRIKFRSNVWRNYWCHYLHIIYLFCSKNCCRFIQIYRNFYYEKMADINQLLTCALEFKTRDEIVCKDYIINLIMQLNYLCSFTHSWCKTKTILLDMIQTTII